MVLTNISLETREMSMHAALVLVAATFLILLVVLGSSERVAVVQFSPLYINGVVTREQATRLKLKNIESVQESIQKMDEADVYVLPEYGLNAPVFISREQAFPYLEIVPNATATSVFPFNDTDLAETSPALVGLSNLSRQLKSYIVANIGSYVNCSESNVAGIECPRHVRYQYNTAVVLGPMGELIGRYYKNHLYYEPFFDAPNNEHDSALIVTLPSGMKLGVLICFDILFKNPMERYREAGVDGLLFPTWWVNTSPFMFATAVQQGVSRTFDFHVLAANAGTTYINSGSGLYDDGSVLASVFNITALNDTEIVSANVSTAFGSPDSSGNWMLDTTTPPSFSNVSSVHMFSVASSPRSATFHVSAGAVSCVISYDIRSFARNDSFAAFAIDGYVDGFAMAQRSCGLVRCNSPVSCFMTFVYDSSTVFDSVEVRTHVHTPFTGHFVPLGGLDSGRLISPKHVEVVQPSESEVHLKTWGVRDALISFGAAGLYEN